MEGCDGMWGTASCALLRGDCLAARQPSQLGCRAKIMHAQTLWRIQAPHLTLALQIMRAIDGRRG